ncbi:MAG: hypothetical protein GY738_07565 [Pseudoalteromonas sp.]|nr:hypothetical protein [Pseudoalteromonas sp.]
MKGDWEKVCSLNVEKDGTCRAGLLPLNIREQIKTGDIRESQSGQSEQLLMEKYADIIAGYRKAERNFPDAWCDICSQMKLKKVRWNFVTVENGS